MPAYFDDVTLTDGPLALRPTRSSDADDVAKACQDPGTQRWLPLPNPYTVEDAEFFLGTVVPQQAEAGGLVRAIELDGRFSGLVDLKAVHRDVLACELGYWVAPWARGQRLAARATRLLAGWALREAGLNRVEIRVAVGNEASLASARAAGAVDEGILRQAGHTHDGLVDLHVLGLLRSDL